jgi:sulfur carrier protein ThiS adenylyltransferase
MLDRCPPGLAERLGRLRVGIAGCGGVGSNVAVALVRTGIGALTVVDRDRVEISNLNRQSYVRGDVGRPKVAALRDALGRISPPVAVTAVVEDIGPEAARRLFAGCDLLVEALDSAANKVMLLESWAGAFPQTPVVACSGIAGYGRSDSIRVRRLEGLVVVGDFESELSLGTTAARVGAVAMLMANEAVRILSSASP